MLKILTISRNVSICIWVGFCPFSTSRVVWRTGYWVPGCNIQWLFYGCEDVSFLLLWSQQPFFPVLKFQHNMVLLVQCTKQWYDLNHQWFTFSFFLLKVMYWHGYLQPLLWPFHLTHLISTIVLIVIFLHLKSRAWLIGYLIEDWLSKMLDDVPSNSWFDPVCRSNVCSHKFFDCSHYLENINPSTPSPTAPKPSYYIFLTASLFLSGFWRRVVVHILQGDNHPVYLCYYLFLWSINCCLG